MNLFLQRPRQPQCMRGPIVCKNASLRAAHNWTPRAVDLHVIVR